MIAVPATAAIGGVLRVSRLGLGTMSLTGPGVWGSPRDPEGARRLLRRARELGVDFFDTADSYGPEVAEVLLREALHPYHDVVVATKAGLTRQGPGRWSRDCRPEHLKAACEASLRRLGVDRLDLFQLHTVDPDVPLEESVGALAELRSEGKVREIGVCNVNTHELLRALDAASIVSVQNRYSVMDRECDAVLELAEQRGLVFIAWAPLAKGGVTRVGGQLEMIGRRHAATPAQTALAWLLHRSPALIAIPGTRSPDHLNANVGALGIRLTDVEMDGIGAQRHVAHKLRRLVRRTRARVGELRSPNPGRA